MHTQTDQIERMARKALRLTYSGHTLERAAMLAGARGALVDVVADRAFEIAEAAALARPVLN